MKISKMEEGVMDLTVDRLDGFEERTQIKVLYLEDNSSDVDLLEIELSKTGNYLIKAIETKDELIKELKGEYDIFICDYCLVGFDGKEAVKIAQKIRPDIPPVILSGTVGEEEAVNILHSGAYDFILKQNLKRIHRVIDRVIQEATRRKQAQIYLKELEDKNALLNSILDSLDDLMFFKDTEAKYIRVNKAFVNYFNISEENIIGKTDRDLFCAEIYNKTEEAHEKVVKNAKSVRFHTEYMKSNGKFSILEIVKTPIVSNGKVIGWVGVSRDVTEKRLLEEMLRRNQLTLSQAEEISGAGSFELNDDLGVLRCSANLLKIFHINSEHDQISLSKLYNIVYEADRVLFMQQFQNAIKNKEALSLTHRIFIDNDIKYCKTSIRPDLTNNNGLYYGIVVNMTPERKQEDIISNIQESERKRISRELHDSIGPKLAAAMMYMDQLHIKEQDEKIAKVRTIVLDSVNEIRDISRSLSVKMVEDNGLENAIEDLFDHIPSEIEKEIKVEINEDEISPMIAAQVYRIVQEAINNMLKHSEASAFKFSMVQDQSILKLDIKDNGSGCNIHEANGKGNGIKNITHRVKRCHGIVRYSSDKGNGFSIEIKVPVK
ncbi:hybrid sensor histidine kinase/response regulator [Fulvivirga lutea]|uniref:histidine kinase n=1 Tax=Fulvivirga lutea TaxID=2810512 RepID=A0A974WM80_9BACT|nr:PAS domain-containing protein [Fulvivirga lutea]QSE98825.1 PAS domain-containing protein [Fulvivirga lutea]